MHKGGGAALEEPELKGEVVSTALSSPPVKEVMATLAPSSSGRDSIEKVKASTATTDNSPLEAQWGAHTV
jgi:hypothetical protein